MRPLGLSLLLAIGLTAVPAAYAQSTDVADIKAMMAKLGADWNGGNMEEFATAYKNSPDILVMGKVIQRGYAAMLAGYKREYPTRERMGKIFFSQVEVQPLDEKFSTATGHFHLDNYDASTNDGFFMVVVEKTGNGWKIVRDDSTVLPNPKK